MVQIPADELGGLPDVRFEMTRQGPPELLREGVDGPEGAGPEPPEPVCGRPG